MFPPGVGYISVSEVRLITKIFLIYFVNIETVIALYGRNVGLTTVKAADSDS
jgi:hypothetical protein